MTQTEHGRQPVKQLQLETQQPIDHHIREKGFVYITHSALNHGQTPTIFACGQGLKAVYIGPLVDPSATQSRPRHQSLVYDPQRIAIAVCELNTTDPDLIQERAAELAYLGYEPIPPLAGHMVGIAQRESIERRRNHLFGS